MKNKIKCLRLLGMVSFKLCSVVVYGQSQEMQQLALDLEKLTQLKSMYGSMVQGYNTLSQGYTAITNSKIADFNLHKNYLDGLLSVSSSVKGYQKINSVISNQALLVKEYKTSFQQYLSGGFLTIKELTALQISGNALIERSSKNIDALLLVVSPGNLRMNDEERISAIDRIDTDMHESLRTVRKILADHQQLILLRSQRKKDIGVMKTLQGLK